MSEDSFDLGAGDLCLDFANTCNWHASEHPEENLHNYSDLIAWGRAAGLLSAESVDRLLQRAREKPEEAEMVYQSAIRTREAIYHIFSNRYAGKLIDEVDLAHISVLVHEASTYRQLVATDDHFEWQWTPSGREANLILWEVAFTAADLLTSDKVVWVRECEDDRGCGYLFIDLSKNHSRRWCSMESCGNRAKARRHYSRSKVERV